MQISGTYADLFLLNIRGHHSETADRRKQIQIVIPGFVEYLNLRNFSPLYYAFPVISMGFSIRNV